METANRIVYPTYLQMCINLSVLLDYIERKRALTDALHFSFEQYLNNLQSFFLTISLLILNALTILRD